MGMWTKTPSFGLKGANDTAKTFAEQLLTGKPMARAPQKSAAPKLKARARARFGRKETTDEDAQPGRSTGTGHGRKFWTVTLLGLMFGLLAAWGAWSQVFPVSFASVSPGENPLWFSAKDRPGA